MVRVAGVDEAGRGAWAGPIVAAAVSLPSDPGLRRMISRSLSNCGVRVNDSKLLSPEDREALVDELVRCDVAVAVAIADPPAIDRQGIGYINAVLMRQAAMNLRPAPDFVLTDAFTLPDFGRNQRAIIHGDRRKSIALASCVAEVTRDRMMCSLDEAHPGYGFARHKGYGTADHRGALERLGVSPVHRASLAPVRALLGNDGV
ncbi:MAG: ribonuclease HII [Thermomicrobiales bacterium]